jgi:hypothetical protein
VRKLASAHEDELAAFDSDDAYDIVAKELAYEVLGNASDEEIIALRENLGTLNEQRWSVSLDNARSWPPHYRVASLGLQN